jgi:tRNA A22 N-methylase
LPGWHSDKEWNLEIKREKIVRNGEQKYEFVRLTRSPTATLSSKMLLGASRKV